MRSLSITIAVAVAVTSCIFLLLDTILPENGYIVACGLVQVIGGMSCILLYSISTVLAEMSETEQDSNAP